MERQQVGLRGDVGDQADHGPDLLHGVAQRANGAVGLIGLGNCLASHADTARGLAADVGDRRREFLGGRRGHADVRGGVGSGARGGAGLTGRGVGECGETIRGFSERAHHAGHRFANAVNGPIEQLDGFAELIAARLGGRNIHFIVTGNGGGDVEQQHAHRDVGKSRGGAPRETKPPADDLQQSGEQPARQGGAGAHVEPGLGLLLGALLAAANPLLIERREEQLGRVGLDDVLDFCRMLGNQPGVERRVGFCPLQIRIHDAVEIRLEQRPNLAPRIVQAGIDAVERQADLIGGGQRHSESPRWRTVP